MICISDIRTYDIFVLSYHIEHLYYVHLLLWRVLLKYIMLILNRLLKLASFLSGKSVLKICETLEWRS